MLKRFRNLSRAERLDLWSAGWRLSCVWCLLPVLGLERARSWLSRFQRRPARRCDGRADLEVWARRATALKRVGGRMPGVRCLARSLCLWWWMRGAGLDPALEIGVRRGEDDAVQSHSWVECDGVPVDETPEVVARFRPLRWHEAAGREASSR
ncbi:MAG: lasso peptide biosynthesis B2 protein [Wenzhouxiangellaceae bacterium]